MTPSVLIVGAGIGALTLAQALRQRGVCTTVVERVPELRAVGAGISLGINAVNVLDRLGFGARLRAVGQIVEGDASRMSVEEPCRRSTLRPLPGTARRWPCTGRTCRRS